MDNNRHIKILCWNVRGINSQDKWDAIGDKISESACHIVCFQETKRENFDPFYLKKFCPRSLDKFALFPSDGASDGILTIWNSSLLEGTLIHSSSYAVTCKFTCKLDNSNFHVSNIYGPSNHAQKQGFATWLMNFDTSDFDNWLLTGDFNLYRQPENRNKPGGDLAEMNLFNELISDLDLTDVPFSGKEYTWSNMQIDPLLIKLDWVLTSAPWSLTYPATHVQPLSRPISDHIPFVIHIGSNIPKSQLFRFENYWTQHPGFLETVTLHWNSSPVYGNAAKNLSSKLKHVRHGLRKGARIFQILTSSFIIPTGFCC